MGMSDDNDGFESKGGGDAATVEGILVDNHNFSSERKSLTSRLG